MENLNNDIKNKDLSMRHSHPKAELRDSEYNLSPNNQSNYHDYDSYFKDEAIRKQAWEKAWQARDFEIKLYWERAKYFWAFIASSYVAYFATVTSNKIQEDFVQLEYIITCIGFIFALAWLLVNIGSKNWQKNWEGHIDRLEEKFTGPLYRTVRKPLYNFSVTRINIIVSSFITLIWLLLMYIFYSRHNYIIVWSCGNLDSYITLANIVTIVFTLLMFSIGKTGFDLFKTKTKYKIREIK